MNNRDDRRASMRISREDMKRTAERSAFSGGQSFIMPPSDVSMWEPDKAGEYLLRIVPYQVSQSGHPDNRPAGAWHYRRPYGAHWNVGGSGQAVVCLKDTFKHGDVICDKVRELSDEDFDGNAKAIRNLRSRRNCIFLVVDVKNDPKKVKIFDWSYSKFAKELEKKLLLAEAEQLDFANADGGMVLKILVVEDAYEGHKYLTVFEGSKDGSVCPGIEFLPGRTFTNLSDELLDQAEKIKLDELFIITPAHKIAELFNAGGDMAAGNEEPTKPAKKPVETPKRKPQVVETDNFEEEEPVKPAKKPAKVEVDNFEGETVDVKPPKKPAKVEVVEDTW